VEEEEEEEEEEEDADTSVLEDDEPADMLVLVVEDRIFVDIDTSSIVTKVTESRCRTKGPKLS
jgi:hypothetical protein